jgi:hypothetical protein
LWIEGSDIVGLVLLKSVFFSDHLHQSWAFAFEFLLGRGCYLVHPLDGNGLLILLGDHRS